MSWFARKRRSDAATTRLVVRPSRLRQRRSTAWLSRRAPRSAFTLTEVMFAVVLLGIGFILVAAMFPVAIQQSRTSTEETVASGLARAALAHLNEIASNDTMPSTGGVVMLHNKASSGAAANTLWQHCAGSLVNAADPRFAWTVLYSRRTDKDPFAQVYVFVLQSRNRPMFDPGNDTTRPVYAAALPTEPKTFAATIEPKQCRVLVRQGTPDRIEIGAAVPDNLSRVVDARAAAAEGAHVVLAGPNAGPHGGTVVRLGNPVDAAAGIWELAPGSDLSGDQDVTAPADAFIIGRGYDADSTREQVAVPPRFEGLAMDVAVLTGYVKVK